MQKLDRFKTQNKTLKQKAQNSRQKQKNIHHKNTTLQVKKAPTLSFQYPSLVRSSPILLTPKSNFSFATKEGRMERKRTRI